MYDLSKIAEFIELRAYGLSYNVCSRRMGISKRTLVDWGSLYAPQIALQKQELLEELQARYKIGELHRVGYLARQYAMTRQELVGRDFSTLSTEKLLNFHLRIDRQLSNETSKIEEQLKARLSSQSESGRVVVLDYSSSETVSGAEQHQASGSVTQPSDGAFVRTEQAIIAGEPSTV
jgi:hypothetical protein